MTLTDLENLFSQCRCIALSGQNPDFKAFKRTSDNVIIAAIRISTNSICLLANVINGQRIYDFNNPDNDQAITFCIKALAVSETHARNYAKSLAGQEAFAGIEEISIRLEQDANKIWILVAVVDAPNPLCPEGPHFHQEVVIPTNWERLPDDTDKVHKFWNASLDFFCHQLSNRNNSTLKI
ncbi:MULTISPECIES: hypothetical protein [unclassified Fibrobacter]|uniref:hypothetical protein n=1 Tax=unclassified Fibrobacter TaxID=2634177 RepID=UPI0025C6E20C|nr:MULTISPECIES: hypothetical protein [unclassified Fibrobacter]